MCLCREREREREQVTQDYYWRWHCYWLVAPNTSCSASSRQAVGWLVECLLYMLRHVNLTYPTHSLVTVELLGMARQDTFPYLKFSCQYNYFHPCTLHNEDYSSIYTFPCYCGAARNGLELYSFLTINLSYHYYYFHSLYLTQFCILIITWITHSLVCKNKHYLIAYHEYSCHHIIIFILTS